VPRLLRDILDRVAQSFIDKLERGRLIAAALFGDFVKTLLQRDSLQHSLGFKAAFCEARLQANRNRAMHRIQ